MTMTQDAAVDNHAARAARARYAAHDYREARRRELAEMAAFVGRPRPRRPKPRRCTDPSCNVHNPRPAVTASAVTVPAVTASAYQAQPRPAVVVLNGVVHDLTGTKRF